MSMFTRMFMVTKTITIMEDAYNVLAMEKLPNESFSDTIRRIATKEEGIEEFFGCWSEEFAERVKGEMAERRAKGRKRAKRRDELFSA